MIEKILYDYLSEELEAPVYMEIPADPPREFVLVMKSGSRRENQIESALITLQSYGETLYDAACLNEDVKWAMLNAIELDSISSARLNSDYNFTDTQSKRCRYQAIFDVVFFNEEA